MSWWQISEPEILDPVLTSILMLLTVKTPQVSIHPSRLFSSNQPNFVEQLLTALFYPKFLFRANLFSLLILKAFRLRKGLTFSIYLYLAAAFWLKLPGKHATAVSLLRWSDCYKVHVPLIKTWQLKCTWTHSSIRHINMHQFVEIIETQ